MKKHMLVSRIDNLFSSSSQTVPASSLHCIPSSQRNIISIFSRKKKEKETGGRSVLSLSWGVVHLFRL